jgi:hypothetical protein
VEGKPRKIFFERAVPPGDDFVPSDEELAALLATASCLLEIRPAEENGGEPTPEEAMAIGIAVGIYMASMPPRVHVAAPERRGMSAWKLAGLLRS